MYIVRENSRLTVRKMAEDNEGICQGNIAMVIGFIFLLIGLIFAIIFFLKGKIYEGIEVTFGFGFISLGIALYAWAFSIKSDKKMRSFATSEFLELAHGYEELKNIIVKRQPSRSYDIWKCEQLMKRAKELLIWNIDREFQEQFARFYYEGLILRLTKQRDTLNETMLKDIKKMYGHIQEFKVDKKYKQYPEKLLGPKKDNKKT